MRPERKKGDPGGQIVFFIRKRKDFGFEAGFGFKLGWQKLQKEENGGKSEDSRFGV